jgi:hypothetical protein
MELQTARKVCRRKHSVDKAIRESGYKFLIHIVFLVEIVSTPHADKASETRCLQA